MAAIDLAIGYPIRFQPSIVFQPHRPP